MRNLLLKKKKNNVKIHKHRITRGLILSATMGAWAILVLAVIWFLAAIGWYMLARLWRQELFVPDAVFSTVGAGLVTFFWAILLSCGVLLWVNYHYQRYYKHNRRQLSPVIMQSEQLLWIERFLDNSCFASVVSIDDETATISENTRSYHEHYPHERLIIGTTLQEDFRDEKGRILLMKGEVITPEIIETMTASGLYGKFVVHLSKQTLETIKERR